MRDQEFELQYEAQSITQFPDMGIGNTGTGNENNIKFTMDCHIDFLMAPKFMKDFTPKDTLYI